MCSDVLRAASTNLMASTNSIKLRVRNIPNSSVLVSQNKNLPREAKNRRVLLKSLEIARWQDERSQNCKINDLS